MTDTVFCKVRMSDLCINW